MKKFGVALLILALLLSILSGCNADVPSAESQKVQSESDTPAETNSLDISNDPTFPFTRAEYVEILKDGLNNLPDGFDVPNAFENEPEVMESLGYNVYTFEVDMCTECAIYAHPETDEVTRVIIRSLSNKMEEENATTLGVYAAFVTGFFATSDEINEMDEALAIADTPYTQNTVNLFTGKNAKFTYTITDGLLTIRISPR